MQNRPFSGVITSLHLYKTGTFNGFFHENMREISGVHNTTPILTP
jgi:hypothetical protein